MAVRTRQVRRYGLANKSMCRALAAALAMLVCIAVPTAGSALAAPAQIESSIPAADIDLGGGSYRVTASVFAEGTDGQVGSTASSGHIIQPNDNLVALPGCTESSCPWVPTGTGTEGAYGPQTTCAEADGLCWVEIVSDDTGQCTVAPVHDRGPLFIRDNWWAPRSLREYNVPQGTPAAEAARNGTNFGFGSGISDAGFDIRNVYTYAAGIDLAGGTWTALGLPVSAGVTTVTVRMLWQAGITHDQACGTAPAPAPTSPPTSGGNATVIDGALNLRSGPSYAASIVSVMPGNSRVKVTGRRQNGFYPIVFGSTSGWALGDYLDIDAGSDPGSDDAPPTNGSATVIDGELNLRSSASTNANVLAVMPDGARVALTGRSSNGFLSVTYQGTSGWAYAVYLRTGDDNPVPPSSGATATVIDGALNLRASASTAAAVVTVLPDGAVVTLAGQSSNGFSKVSWNGSSGWAYSIYLSTGGDDGGSGNGTFATVFDGALNLRSGAGMEYDVLMVMPDAARVELTGSTGNGFTRVIYNGTTGWASSQWLRTGGSIGSTAKVIDGELNLRASASTSASVLAVMPNNATVTPLGQSSNGFAKVRYNGIEGWAYEEYLD